MATGIIAEYPKSFRSSKMRCPVCGMTGNNTAGTCPIHYAITYTATGEVVSYTEIVPAYVDGYGYHCAQIRTVYVKKSV